MKRRTLPKNNFKNPKNNFKNIYLPIFSGFYNSIHELDVDYIEESFSEDVKNGEGAFNDMISEDEKTSILNGDAYMYNIIEKYFDIDFKQYEVEYSKEYYNEFKNLFWKWLKEKLWIDLQSFASLYSPREYNFDTDHININIKYNYKKIFYFLHAHKKAFTTYIKNSNTSYDGFFAYGTNQLEMYLNKVLTNSLAPFELTQIIDFFLEVIHQNTYTEIDIDIYYEVIPNIITYDYLNIIKKD